MTSDELRDKIQSFKTLRGAAKDACDSLRAEVAAHTETIASLRRLLSIVRKDLESGRQMLDRALQEVVTRVLKLICGADYGFRLDRQIQRRRTKILYGLSGVVDGQDFVEDDPIKTSGGGMANLVTLGLRIAVLGTFGESVKCPMILDETLHFLGNEQAKVAGEFLARYSEREDRQIIVVGHQAGLRAAAHSVFEFCKRAGLSMVERSLDHA